MQTICVGLLSHKSFPQCNFGWCHKHFMHWVSHIVLRYTAAVLQNRLWKLGDRYSESKQNILYHSRWVKSTGSKSSLGTTCMCCMLSAFYLGMLKYLLCSHVTTNWTERVAPQLNTYDTTRLHFCMCPMQWHLHHFWCMTCSSHSVLPFIKTRALMQTDYDDHAYLGTSASDIWASAALNQIMSFDNYDENNGSTGSNLQ